MMKSYIDTCRVNFNLACAVHALEQITATEIPKRFAETGPYSFQMDFGQRFHRNEDGLRNDGRCKALLKAGVALRLGIVMKRMSDTKPLQNCERLFQIV